MPLREIIRFVHPPQLLAEAPHRPCPRHAKCHPPRRGRLLPCDSHLRPNALVRSCPQVPVARDDFAEWLLRQDRIPAEEVLLA